MKSKMALHIIPCNKKLVDGKKEVKIVLRSFMKDVLLDPLITGTTLIIGIHIMCCISHML